ncbi:hypothetical protein H2203_005135 [Taxawa tesnikishii (nom. ined.)]|nr:hypothetical protein H2203_005135 [Dothideales sp. JES 119]
MDVSAHGVGATNGIAIGCRGSNSDGSCQFDELMKYIHNPGKKTPLWSGSTDIGDDFFPDPVHAAEELHNNGYNNAFDSGKLFPNIWPNGGQQQLGALLSAVTDRIQAARQTSGDDYFTRELRSARSAITIATEARLADLANYRIPAINTKLHDQGITWNVETETRLGQESSWTDVDIYKTLKNHPNESQEIVDIINDFETNWMQSDGDARRHDRAIKACQAAANRVFGDCNK